MAAALFSNVVLPVGDPKDAATTARAALPYVMAVDGRVTALYVVEKAGGAPDKAGVEQREEVAEKMFDAVREAFAATDVAVDTRIAYGTDVAETVFDVAEDVGASAVAFTPRGGSRWVRLLTGDTALDLITENDRPVVVLPGGTHDAADATDATDTAGDEGGDE